jgi:hypothetical protein
MVSSVKMDGSYDGVEMVSQPQVGIRVDRAQDTRRRQDKNMTNVIF